MAKKEKKTQGGTRLDELFESGNVRGARAEAKRILADAAAPETDKEAARQAQVRAAPDRGVILVAAAGFALILFVIYFGVLRH